MKFKHISLSENKDCGVKQHSDVLNEYFGDPSSKNLIFHYPFRLNGTRKYIGHLKLIFEFFFKNRSLFLHEYVRLGFQNRIYLNILILLSKSVFVINSRNFWLISKFKRDVVLAPSFSPNFFSDSGTPAINKYSNSLHLLGIQDLSKKDKIFSFLMNILKNEDLQYDKIYVADPRFFSSTPKIDEILLSDFPLLSDVNDPSNSVILLTFPAIDENRSMAIATLGSKLSGIIIVNEIIPNLISVIIDITPVNISFAEALKSNSGLYIAVSKNKDLFFIDSYDIYKVNSNNEALYELFSLKNVLNYWQNFKTK